MVRKPAVAGMFYPGDEKTLRGMVEGFLETAGVVSDPGVTGIVSPHAGYMYSGSTAGAAFAKAPDHVDTVVVVAPPHRYPVHGASVFDGEGYMTPLGVAPVDRVVTERLLGAGLVYQPRAHVAEHSAEVQVPFIQVKWPAAEITVVLQGSTDPDFSGELAAALLEALRGRDHALVVASSDLSHYQPLEIAKAKDRLIIDAFLSGDPEALERAAASGGEACGIGPMKTLMRYAILNGSREFGAIAWTTSAEASGDTSAVVGYFAGFCSTGR